MRIKGMNLKNLGIYLFSLTSSALFVLILMAIRPTTLTAYPSMGILEQTFDNLAFIKSLSFSLEEGRPVVVPYVAPKLKSVKRVKHQVAHKKVVKKVVVKKYAAHKIINKWDLDHIDRIKINLITDQKFQKFLASYKPIHIQSENMVAHQNKQSAKESEVVADRVKTKLASILKNDFAVKQNKSDDLVIYDYSGSEKKISFVSSQKESKRFQTAVHSNYQKKVATVSPTSIAVVSRSQVSPTLQKAIQRITKRGSKKHSNEKVKLPANVGIASDSTLPQTMLAMKSLTSQAVTSQNEGLIIKTDFISDKSYDIEAQLDSAIDMPVPYEKGSFDFYFLSSHRRGVDNITITGEEIFPLVTRVDYQVKSKLPLLSIERAKKLGLIEGESALLIRTEFIGQPLDLDSGYKKVVILDDNLNETTSDGIFQLFIGVPTGLHSISYLTKQRETVEIPVEIRPELLNYVAIKTLPGQETKLSVYRQVVGRLSSVNDEVQISYFGSSLSLYRDGKEISFLSPLRSILSKSYLELSLDSRKVYIGIGQKSKNSITLSSDYVLDELLESAGVDDSDSVCIVEVVKPNGVDAISTNNMFKMFYLDSDGKIYEELGPETKSIYLIGDRDMIRTVALDYIDGQSKAFQAICSPGSYFIETP